MQSKGRNRYLIFLTHEKWLSNEKYKKIVAHSLIFWVLTVDIKVSFVRAASIHPE
jgi:hypothetical protein